MGSFFSIDGAFYKYGSMLADVMIISLLWIVFSLPIITAGASTTAAYYVFTKRVVNNDGYLFRDFWKSYKQNMWMSVRVWGLVLVIGALLITNILNMGFVEGNIALFLLPAQWVILAELVFINFYAYPLLARFDLKFFVLIKTAFFMANRHLLTTIMTTLIFVGLVFLVDRYFIVILVFPGVFCFLTSFFFMKIFKKYNPEIAPDPTYDDFKPILTLEEEAEQNRREAEQRAMEEAAQAQADAAEAIERMKEEHESN